MKRNLGAILLAAATALIASSACASGYGPAPFYRPDVGSTFPRHRHCGKHAWGADSENCSRDAGDTSDAGGAGSPGTESGGAAPSPVEFSTFSHQ
jgi:hypothetical protein